MARSTLGTTGTERLEEEGIYRPSYACLAVIACRQAVIAYRQAVIACRQAVIAYRQAVIACRQAVIAYRQAVIACRQAVIACRQRMTAADLYSPSAEAGTG